MGLLSSKKSSSTSTTIAQDMRIGVESMGSGQLVGPEATLAQGGGVSTRASRDIKQSFADVSFGLSGENVRDILRESGAQAQQASQLTSSAINALAAGKTGEPINWTRYIPIVAIAAVVLLLRKRT